MQLEAYFLQIDWKVLFQLTNFQFIEFIIHVLVFVPNWTNHSSELFFQLFIYVCMYVCMYVCISTS